MLRYIAISLIAGTAAVFSDWKQCSVDAMIRSLKTEEGEDTGEGEEEEEEEVEEEVEEEEEEEEGDGGERGESPTAHGPPQGIEEEETRAVEGAKGGVAEVESDEVKEEQKEAEKGAEEGEDEGEEEEVDEEEEAEEEEGEEEEEEEEVEEEEEEEEEEEQEVVGVDEEKFVAVSVRDPRRDPPRSQGRRVWSPR